MNYFTNKINIFFVVILFSLKTLQAVTQPIPAAEYVNDYLLLLKGKQIGLVINNTSLVRGKLLIDTLRSLNVSIKCIFGPEHGFRGNADAGEKVLNAVDPSTNIPIISLYGKNKKPSPEQLKGIETLIFDIQDVGARFYTYISTLHYIMEACAENKIGLIVLDRPNPNGMYVAGPVLDTAFKSFVGMHPVPIVYGMTIGEYAAMINGEGWLRNGLKCNLTIIPCKNYTHKSIYSLPVKPSPNLPNDLSIAMYPSLCLFEGTNVSVARGTYFPFQAIGYPDSAYSKFYFTPKSISGMSKDPMHLGKKCYGIDLRNSKTEYNFTLQYLIDFYNLSSNKELFFNNFFNKLAGNAQLMQQIKQGISEAAIIATWQQQLRSFKSTRKKYLLYPDFE